MNRCDDGKSLFRQWSDAVKNALNETWQEIFWGGLKDYNTHLASCYVCQQYEQERLRKRNGVADGK